MARTTLSMLLLLPLLALAGCSDFFNFNVYSTFDTVAAPSADKYEGSGGLAALATDLSSPAVVEALKNDPTTTAAIESYLVTTYLSGAVTSSDQQQAVILYADLNLKTTEGESFVNNIVTTVMGGVTTGTSIHDLLDAVLPADAKSDPAVFSAMITALRNSNTQYLKLGAGITDVNSNGTIEVGEGVPAGTNMGDVAQKAAVAFAIEDCFQEISIALTGTPSDATVITQMYLLATDPTAANAAAQALTPDPYTAGSDAYVTVPTLKKIQNIFDCAGLALPS
jgi:hypothetical protein